MLKTRAIALAIGLLAGDAAWAGVLDDEFVSQRPSPSLRESDRHSQAQAQGQAERSSDHQGQTQTAPTIIYAVPAPKTEQEKERDRREREDEAIRRRWEVIAAVITAIFTIVLGISTIALWRVTKRTADAANISANAFMDGERAWMQITSTEMTGFPPPSEKPQGRRPVGVVKVTAFGKTPAALVRYANRMHFIKSEADLPEHPYYGTFINVDERDIVVPGGLWKMFAALENNDGVVSIPTFDKVASGDLKIVLYGIVEYKDAFGRDCEMRYCRIWWEPAPNQEKRRRFLRFGSNAYNGHRQAKHSD